MMNLLPFDQFRITSYAGRRFAFKDHGNASYFGRGPWVLAEGETGSYPDHGGFCTLKFVPTADGFAFSPFVTVWSFDVNDTFEVSE